MHRIDLVHRVEVEKAPDLVHRVRGLSFFKQHVAQGVASIGRREGVPARFDEKTAPRIFLSWIDALMAQRAFADVDRRDYITFGAGILLKTLLEERPIRLLSGQAKTTSGSGDLVSIWPEGFLATSYCLSVLDAVLDQEGLETFALGPAASDRGVWQSFRENVMQDPRLAIAYLDLFIGNEPNWTVPTWARSRSAQKKVGGQRALS
jgi:hypothetical protein